MPNATKAGRQTSAANIRGEDWQAFTLKTRSDGPLLGKHPSGIRKQQPQLSTRKSTRLEEIRSRQKPAASKGGVTDFKRSHPAPSTSTIEKAC